MEKKNILENLINYYSDGNKSQFANKLGVKPQTINTWLTRNSFDVDLIYSKCENVSGDWLLSGEGEMLRSQNVTSDVNKELLTLCKELVANYKQRDNVMGKLVSMVKIYDDFTM